MAGIKETQEVIAFVKILSETIEDAKAGGSIDIFDIVKAIRLISPLTAAVNDSDKIDDELKDLDRDEIQQLLASMQEAITALVRALTKKEGT